jgi:putative ABC transport system permease protein
MLLLGSVLGIAGAAVASRFLQSLLFGVRSGDIPSYILGVLPLIFAGLLASVVPARRTAYIDPLITMRNS